MTVSIRVRDFESFFKAPFSTYGVDGFYVSPLKSDLKNFLTAVKNPLFKNDNDFCYYTAHKDGKILGRIVAHVHRASNELYGLNRAYFGFFDCADDTDAAAALLQAAEGWARERGFSEIIGNFNLTIAQQIGVTTGGFDCAPYVDMVYSPPHVARLLETYGYARFFQMTTSTAAISDVTPQGLLSDNAAHVLQSPDYEWKPVTRKGIGQSLADARLLLNDAFVDNPMFVPLTAEEFAFQTQSLASIVDPRISVVVYFKGRPAGVIICIPDVNPMLQKMGSKIGWRSIVEFIKHRIKRKRAVIVYYAVAKDLHGKGINSAMLYKLVDALRSAGYSELGGTWIADENKPSLRMREKMNMSVAHCLHLFKKDL